MQNRQPGRPLLRLAEQRRIPKCGCQVASNRNKKPDLDIRERVFLFFRQCDVGDSLAFSHNRNHQNTSKARPGQAAIGIIRQADVGAVGRRTVFISGPGQRSQRIIQRRRRTHLDLGINLPVVKFFGFLQVSDNHATITRNILANFSRNRLEKFIWLQHGADGPCDVTGNLLTRIVFPGFFQEPSFLNRDRHMVGERLAQRNDLIVELPH